VAGINERFDTVVRVNNTRREVLRNSELLVFIDEEEKAVGLTAKGRAVATAYVAAGGATGPVNDSA
jgi:hypothetical protein